MKRSPIRPATLMVAAVAGAAAALGLASAQDGVPRTQIEAGQGAASRDAVVDAPGFRAEPETTAIEAPPLPGDEEYGEQVILARRSNWMPWTFGASVSPQFTDNVALVPDGERNDWYLESILFGAYTPKLKGDLFGDILIKQSFFRYDEFDVLDFDLFRADAGLLYVVPQLGKATVFARYGYYRIMDEGFGDSIFQTHYVSTGVQKLHKISRGQTVYGAVGAQIKLDAEPAIAGRNEYFWHLGYSIEWTDRFMTGVGYRGAYNDYDELGRGDWNHALNVAAVFELTDWAEVRASFGFTANRSDRALFEYDNWIAGCGLGVRVRF